MRKLILATALLSSATLITACQSKEADAVEDNAEAQADAIDDQADMATTDAQEEMLENKADKVEEMGEEKANAMGRQWRDRSQRDRRWRHAVSCKAFRLGSGLGAIRGRFSLGAGDSALAIIA